MRLLLAALLLASVGLLMYLTWDWPLWLYFAIMCPYVVVSGIAAGVQVVRWRDGD